MPTYTEFSAFNTGDLLTALHVNNIVGNIEYLVAGVYVIDLPATGSNYTTTSTTLVDVDATEFDRDIVTTADASAVRVWAQLMITGPAAQLTFEFTRDGTPLVGGAFGVARYYEVASGQGHPIFFQFIDDGITPGNTHSYRLQWKVASGTGTIIATSGVQPFFAVEEVH
jgi:hypothetical protein